MEWDSLQACSGHASMPSLNRRSPDQKRTRLLGEALQVDTDHRQPIG